MNGAMDPWAPVAYEDAPATPKKQPERIVVRAHDRAPKGVANDDPLSRGRRSNDPSEPVTPHLHVPLALPLTVPDKVLEPLAEVAESNRKLAEQIERQNTMMQQAAADAADAHLQMMAAIGGLGQVVQHLVAALLGRDR